MQKFKEKCEMSDKKWMSNFRMIQLWSRVKKCTSLARRLLLLKIWDLRREKKRWLKPSIYMTKHNFLWNEVPLLKRFNLNSEDFQGLLWVRVKWFRILERYIKSLRSFGHYGCHESWVFSRLVLHSHSTIKINHMKRAHFTIRLLKTKQEAMIMTCVWYESIRIPC